MLRVGYVIGDPAGHAVRGIGVYNKNLLPVIQKLGKKEKIEVVSVADHRSLGTGHYDIVHWPYFDFFTSTLSLVGGQKTIVSIYDCIPLIYPKNYPSGVRGAINFWKQKHALGKVDAVITISDTSKKDIVRFLDVPSQKIHVVYGAPGNEVAPITDHGLLMTVQKKYALPSSFVLYVGDINYNKNVLNLVKACNLTKTPLVIVGKHATQIETIANFEVRLDGPRDMARWFLGKPHPEVAHYRDLLAQIAKSKHVIRLGFVDPLDLAVIYSLATVYCQPSFYEGLGMGVLEAFAAGLPVVASKAQALVEVAGKAALYFDPNSPDDIAAKITKVISDGALSSSLVKNGSERLRLFSWAKTAKLVLDVYKSLAAN